MPLEARSVFMRQAIALALEGVNANRGGPFGALVVRGDEVIGVGTNEVTSTNDPTAHAEIVAIRAACARYASFELAGCELYTSCEPCPMCLAAIHWARIERVYFACTRQDAADAGFDDALLYELFEQPEKRRAPELVPWLRDEARILFSVWRDKPDKTPY